MQRVVGLMGLQLLLVAVTLGQLSDECKDTLAARKKCIGQCSTDNCGDLSSPAGSAGQAQVQQALVSLYRPCFDACKEAEEGSSDDDWTHPPRGCWQRKAMRQCIDKCELDAASCRAAADGEFVVGCKRALCECVNERIEEGGCEGAVTRDCLSGWGTHHG